MQRRGEEQQVKLFAQCSLTDDLHQQWGNLCVIQASIRWTEKGSNGQATPKDSKHISVLPCPGSMTIETTVSKGQEFFSPGQTEGDAGGTFNWERCGDTVVDTTKMDNVDRLNQEFLQPTLCTTGWT